MEDFFYFTRSTITLVEIAEIATEFQYQHEFIQYNNEYLNIYSKDKAVPQSNAELLIHWQCSKISEEEGDFASFEPSSRVKVAEFGPSSSFMISYHLNLLEELALFFKRLLEKHGGWIGTDFADFEPIYEINNIDSLPTLTRICYRL